MTIPGDILLDEGNYSNLIKGKDLVIGAIELAYKQMDQMVEHQAQNGGGGCTAITILFFNGKLYAAGAGDSRLNFVKVFLFSVDLYFFPHLIIGLYWS